MREVYTHELDQVAATWLFGSRYAKFLRVDFHIYVTSSNITHIRGIELLRLNELSIRDAGHLEANSGAFPTLDVRDYSEPFSGVWANGFDRDGTISVLESVLRNIRINDTKIRVTQPPPYRYR